MPIPGAAVRLGRCATGLAATFQATLATAQEGAACGNPFAAQAYPQKLTRLRRANNLIYRTAAR